MTHAQKLKQNLSHEEFTEAYVPIANPLNSNASHYGCMFETHGEEFAFVQVADPKCVWTLYEEEGVAVIRNSFHLVNRLGYFITENPCPTYPIEVYLSEAWDIAADYAEQILAEKPEDSAWLLNSCEEQGIIAAGVCFHLMQQGKNTEAKNFINRMIKNMEEI